MPVYLSPDYIFIKGSDISYLQLCIRIIAFVSLTAHCLFKIIVLTVTMN